MVLSMPHIVLPKGLLLLQVNIQEVYINHTESPNKKLKLLPHMKVSFFWGGGAAQSLNFRISQFMLLIVCGLIVCSG